MNDQNPFDVASDDDRRPAAAAQPSAEPTRTAQPPSSPHPEEPESSASEDAASRTAHRKHQRIAALSVAAAVIFTAGAGGGAVASLALARSTTTASVDGGTSTQRGTSGSGAQNGFGSQGGFDGSQGGLGRFGDWGSGPNGSGSSADAGSTTATADQITGLVTVVSQLGYENGEAAGTGIVLTANGRILTNNHVIDNATAIRVTVASTGKSYTARVVGTNATKDVAVLQLQNASGLTPADLASSVPSVGADVTAVGNANGTGTLSAAAGTVTALGQTITTSSEGSTRGETLHGLIEISADVVSGDSGGAVEDSSGAVVGVTTAASSGAPEVTGYAIPIGQATSIAKRIVAGDDTAQITIGLPAFLGVSISSRTTGTSGAVVGSVLQGTAAARTDLAAGDTITAVDGTAVSSAAALSKAIAAHHPGDRVTIHYVDTDGASHSVPVTLMEGPAD